MSIITINTEEWKHVTPDNEPELKGRFLRDESARATAAILTEKKILEIIELKNGLSIKVNSYVGRIALGDIQINVIPKLNGIPLYQLLKYAYGLRDLKLFENSLHEIDKLPFFDILIYQLYIETEELFIRGMYRSYIKKHEELASPRGRININMLTQRDVELTATMPCDYFERSNDMLLNRVILAGLRLGLKLAEDAKLKLQLHRLILQLSENIGQLEISRQILKRTWNETNRLTSRYKPILELINILFESQGIQLEDGLIDMQLHGFFFDMNSFYETLISKLIRNYLKGFTLRDQHSLHVMFEYTPGFNPQRRRPPVPRPDFAITDGYKIVKLLDAKYRDLWETTLPREMLYQLAVYAMSGVGNSTATIIYPTINKSAAVQKIKINDPTTDVKMAEVILQPVDLEYISELVSNSRISNSGKVDYVNSVVFG